MLRIYPSSPLVQASLDEGFSENDLADSTMRSGETPRSVNNSALLTLIEYEMPRTPQKSPPLVSNDSAISVTENPSAEELVKLEDCFASPLAGAQLRRQAQKSSEALATV